MANDLPVAVRHAKAVDSDLEEGCDADTANALEEEELLLLSRTGGAEAKDAVNAFDAVRLAHADARHQHVPIGRVATKDRLEG